MIFFSLSSSVIKKTIKYCATSKTFMSRRMELLFSNSMHEKRHRKPRERNKADRLIFPRMDSQSTIDPCEPIKSLWTNHLVVQSPITLWSLWTNHHRSNQILVNICYPSLQFSPQIYPNSPSDIPQVIPKWYFPKWYFPQVIFPNSPQIFPPNLLLSLEDTERENKWIHWIQ